MLKYPTKPLGEVLANFDSRRIPLSGRDREKRRGPYRYYGAAGVIDYVDQPLFSGLHLLIGEDGSVVRDDGTPFAQLADGEFWVNNHAHVLRGETDSETRYVYYALRTTNVRPWVTGAVQPKLNQRNMNQIQISFPVRSVREQIVKVLGALDDKIEQNRQTAWALERLARATFRAWFVGFEPVKAKAAGADSFPSIPPHVFDSLPTRFVDSEIGPVPEGWEVMDIGDVVTVKGGGTPSTKTSDYWDGGKHCWATPRDMSRLRYPVLLDTERRITDAGVNHISSGLLPVGTVLMSSRAPVGYLAIAGVPTAINQGFIAMVCDGPLPPTFILNWAFSQMETIKARASGTTFPEISKKNFRPLTVVRPTDDVIATYQQAVEPLFDLLAACVKENVRLAEMRDYLLPQLLSGHIRVEVADG